MIFIKKTSNAINFIIFTMLFSGGFYNTEKVFALSGREIMEKVNARDEGDRSKGEMEMILIAIKILPLYWFNADCVFSLAASIILAYTMRRSTR